MERRISLKFLGAILAPSIIVAFFIGLFLASGINLTQKAESAPEPVSGSSQKTSGSRIPLITEEGESPFVKVAKEVIPAVVNISAEKRVVIKTPRFEFDWGPFEDFFRQFPFPQPEPRARRYHTLGSGVLIDAKGYILTNNHVVAGYDKIMVKLADNTEFKAPEVKVIGKDSKTDIAVLKIEPKNGKLPYAKLGNSDEVKIGDWAIAIGNPFGLEGTVTVGVISAKGRSGIPLSEGPTYQDFIQTDASINPGNSGGPLVNIKGEVIGINTAIRSPVGANVGIGFATPINLAKKIVDELITKGKITRGYLGVRPQEITKDMKEALGLESTEGVLIQDVLENTPADKAGIKPGDVILKFNGIKITDVEHFRMTVAEVRPGTEVSVELVRDGKTKTLTVILTEFPEEEVAEAPEKKEEKPWLGLKVRNLTSEEKSSQGANYGVLVEKIEENSPAEESGILEGDIIQKIDRFKIENYRDFSKVQKELKKRKKPILFQLKRDKRNYFITVTP